MAKIWPVYEGKEPTIGGPWANLPVADAVDLFDLQADDYVSDVTSDVRFGDVSRFNTIAGYKYIVVEIDRNEGQKANWTPGFYRSQVTPNVAFRKLIQHALATKLGAENVVRLETEPTTDSQGQEALKITVVIAPGAAERLEGGAVLDALVKLQERLHEMGESRTPIIAYATEAELEQDVGS